MVMRLTVICWCSFGFKGSRKSTPLFAAQMASEAAFAKSAQEHSLKSVEVTVKGQSFGVSHLRALAAAGLE